MWWRFRRHRLAMVATVIVAFFYLGVIFTEFLAYAPPTASEAQRSLLPPQRIHWFDEGRFSPHVFGLTAWIRHAQAGLHAGPVEEDPGAVFVSGFEYHFLGLFPASLHLLGVEDARPEETLFLLGTDEQGRDQWSRLDVREPDLVSRSASRACARPGAGRPAGRHLRLLTGVIDTVIQRSSRSCGRSRPSHSGWVWQRRFRTTGR